MRSEHPAMANTSRSLPWKWVNQGHASFFPIQMTLTNQKNTKRVQRVETWSELPKWQLAQSHFAVCIDRAPVYTVPKAYWKRSCTCPKSLASATPFQFTMTGRFSFEDLQETSMICKLLTNILEISWIFFTSSRSICFYAHPRDDSGYTCTGVRSSGNLDFLPRNMYCIKPVRSKTK